MEGLSLPIIVSKEFFPMKFSAIKAFVKAVHVPQVKQLLKETLHENADVNMVDRFIMACHAAPMALCPMYAPLEVKASPKHGRGCFFRFDLPAGIWVTKYPGHFGSKRVESDRTPLTLVNLCGGRELSVSDKSRYLEHLPHPSGMHSCIVGHPDIADNPWEVGHLVNDAATFPPRLAERCYELDDIESMLFIQSNPEVFKAVIDYTNADRNVALEFVEHNGLYVVCGYVTTRAVKAGEEAFAMYGHTYWRPGVGGPE